MQWQPFFILRIADRPFKLDHFRDDIRYIPPFRQFVALNPFTTHIFFSQSRRKFLGFPTLLVTWHLSVCLASHALCESMIDTQANFISRPRLSQQPINFSSQSAAEVIFFFCYNLMSLGYFLGLQKSILVSSIQVPDLRQTCICRHSPV